MSKVKITLYTAGTPNGHKVSIALEALNIPYKVHHISFTNNEQKEEWFLKINPNGRIPAIVDHSNNDFAVFETGAIMLYLADKYDPEHKLLPKDDKLKSEAIQWLMWQMGGLGPMMGQANHFLRYAPEKIEYGINRYKNETKRLFLVLEARLKGRNYLVGDVPTVADIASFPWVRIASWTGIELSEFPNTSSWLERLGELDFVQRGLDVPEKDKIKHMLKDPALAAQQAEEASNWVLKGQKEQEEKYK
ncbi:theta class glutathione S-transferase [Neoconidiobolus thromboides FSU 785]|nr:theta class glutathione S-transferase [Neoconidiobolus thromboides FSU 785]